MWTDALTTYVRRATMATAKFAVVAVADESALALHRALTALNDIDASGECLTRLRDDVARQAAAVFGVALSSSSTPTTAATTTRTATSAATAATSTKSQTTASRNEVVERLEIALNDLNRTSASFAAVATRCVGALFDVVRPCVSLAVACFSVD